MTVRRGRLRFFSGREAATLRAVAARVVGWPPGDDLALTPVVRELDARLAEGVQGGSRYAGMPAAGEAWKLGLLGIDHAALSVGGAIFTRLAPDAQLRVLHAVALGAPPGEAWQSLPARTFFERLLVPTVARLALALEPPVPATLTDVPVADVGTAPPAAAAAESSFAPPAREPRPPRPERAARAASSPSDRRRSGRRGDRRRR